MADEATPKRRATRRPPPGRRRRSSAEPGEAGERDDERGSAPRRRRDAPGGDARDGARGDREDGARGERGDGARGERGDGARGNLRRDADRGPARRPRDEVSDDGYDDEPPAAPAETVADTDVEDAETDDEDAYDDDREDDRDDDREDDREDAYDDDREDGDADEEEDAYTDEEEFERERRPRRARDDGRVRSAAQAARIAARELAGLTGRAPDNVVSIQKRDDGWCVSVELVETHRIPDSADILAVYQIDLDSWGELMSYRRVDRYLRGRVEGR